MSASGIPSAPTTSSQTGGVQPARSPPENRSARPSWTPTAARKTICCVQECICSEVQTFATRDHGPLQGLSHFRHFHTTADTGGCHLNSLPAQGRRAFTETSQTPSCQHWPEQPVPGPWRDAIGQDRGHERADGRHDEGRRPPGLPGGSVGGGPWPALVLVHEAFGLDDEMRRHADRLAAMGYLVLAPDLLARGRRMACLAQTFRALRRGRGRTFDDIEAVRDAALADPRCSGAVGVIEFCLGGGFALVLAGRRAGMPLSSTTVRCRQTCRPSTTPALWWRATAGATCTCAERRRPSRRLWSNEGCRTTFASTRRRDMPSSTSRPTFRGSRPPSHGG